jgi:ATP-binding cassette subfamily B protein
MLWFGGVLVMTGQLTFGELVAFYAYLLQLVLPIRRGGWLVAMGSRASASADRIFEILDTPVDVQDRPDARPLPPIAGNVELRDVSCAYFPGRPVLEDVNLVVEPGQTLALVGGTGSGKTTIANLIPRFYDVSSGQVLIDGHDVRDVQLQSLRRQIGVVQQETRLFAVSIRENIAFGVPDASEETVVAAARAARAHDFIQQLPDGYDTILEERGAGLSGGQRQRIAIARALLLDPRILILDEFTSSVDLATERLIREALLTLMQNRTTIVIAHRVATVRTADQIIVMEAGRVAARGTHQQLIETSPEYREIYAEQLENERVAREPLEVAVNSPLDEDEDEISSGVRRLG